MMQKIGLVIAAAAFVLAVSVAGAQARSCSDVLYSCMKMHGNQVGGKQSGGPPPETCCRNDYNGGIPTGSWAGQTMTIKGLERSEAAQREPAVAIDNCRLAGRGW
jgi:hypothetical protein